MPRTSWVVWSPTAQLCSSIPSFGSETILEDFEEWIDHAWALTTFRLVSVCNISKRRWSAATSVVWSSSAVSIQCILSSCCFGWLKRGAVVCAGGGDHDSWVWTVFGREQAAYSCHSRQPEPGPAQWVRHVSLASEPTTLSLIALWVPTPYAVRVQSTFTKTRLPCAKASKSTYTTVNLTSTLYVKILRFRPETEEPTKSPRKIH
jgi:hypothetical protein